MRRAKAPSAGDSPLSERRVDGEVGLLRRIRERVERGERGERVQGGSGSPLRGGVRLGIGDDCALLRIKPEEELAVTTDLSIEGRHFRIDWHPAESVGHRALARGLSDLAAMGAKPVAAFLSLGLPRTLITSSDRTPAWVDRFYDGLLALAEEYKVTLAGGDLAESPLAVADIVLTGAVPRDKALLRSGARAGDLIYVTGSLGGAAAELEQLSRSPRAFLESASARENHPHLYPRPRVAQGLWLRKNGLASAAIDLSDGISTDLNHLCAESNVAAELRSACLPLEPRADLALALHGGEDYELLFTAPRSAKLPRRIAGVPITAIGKIIKARRGKARVTLITEGGSEPLEARGWEHFKAEKTSG